MTTNSHEQTLTDVIKIIREKLGEAKDYVREMDKKKCVPRTFRYRLSAFLSAAESVTEFMETQGKRYARQKGKGAVFEHWFAGKEDLFRTPHNINPKKGRNLGTDAVWVYLRAARHETIHIEQVRPVHLARNYFQGRFHLRAESEPEPPPPPVTVPVQSDNC